MRIENEGDEVGERRRGGAEGWSGSEERKGGLIIE